MSDQKVEKAARAAYEAWWNATRTDPIEDWHGLNASERTVWRLVAMKTIEAAR